MKRLEELGISPAPWFVDEDSNIGCHYISHAIRPNERRIRIVAKPNYYFAEYKADVRLIAAAPELYAALFEMVEMYRDGGSYDYEQDVIKMAKAALAKAAGEEVGDGK